MLLCLFPYYGLCRHTPQREFNPYFYEIPIAQAVHAIPVAQPVDPYNNATDSHLQEWQVGQALPAAPTEMLYPPPLPPSPPATGDGETSSARRPRRASELVVAVGLATFTLWL